MPDTPAGVQFQTELRLLLEEIAVVPSPEGFLDATAAAQLAALRPILPAGGSAVWFDPSVPGTLRAAVATLDTGRADIRVVDVPADPSGAADLALAVRELLEARYADLPPPPPPPQPPAPAAPPPPVRWNLALVTLDVPPTLVELRGGLALQTAWPVGELLRIGARLGVQGGGAGGWLQPGVDLQRGLWTAGGELSVVRHPWGTQLRPGVRGGVRWIGDKGLVLGADLTVLPIRDLVHRDQLLRYDSGRFEGGLEVGWARAVTPEDAP